jgi:hypothetical protein
MIPTATPGSSRRSLRDAPASETASASTADLANAAPACRGRVGETTTRTTWPAIHRELDRIALGAFTGPAGTFRQRTELSKAQRDILAQLKTEPPPRIFQLNTETP